MAETYGIYDYESLPLETVGILASGLDETSRIYKKITGNYYSQTDLILAMIADDLNAYLYSMAKKSRRGKPPKSLVAEMTKNSKKEIKTDDREIKFSSPEDFETERKRIMAQFKET